MNNKHEQTFGIDFLDFLFTVSVGVGFTPEVLNIEWAKGILSEQWVQDGRPPCGPEILNLGTFFLCFLTLVLSWFGYHVSISAKSLKSKSIYGMFRFIIDVLLVILYGSLLLIFRDLNAVFFLLFIIYLIYAIWDVLKIKEYPEKYKNDRKWLVIYRRECVTFFWFLCFTFLWLLYSIFNILPSWFSVILGIAFNIFYRINKISPLWEQLFGVTKDDA